MANKIAAVLVMCFVLVAAVQLQGTEAAVLDEFSSCFNTCHKECEDGGNGSTFCEMKCDADCVAKETAAKLNIKP